MKSLYRVKGMTCGLCTAAVTEALQQVPGVLLASVLLLTEEALVTYDPTTSADALRLVIEDCGFDAETLRTDQDSKPENPKTPLVTLLLVLGMTCGLCLATITEQLEKMPGVELVAVSLVTEVARVVHSPKVAPLELVGVIEDCGFEAEVQLLVQSKGPQMAVSRFHVDGMTCALCLLAITTALLAVDGIETAAVSEITEEALVKHTPAVKPDEIRTTIEDCGFDARLIRSLMESEPLQADLDTEDEVNLQIFGADDRAHWNAAIDNYLEAQPGVISHQALFALAGEHDDDNEDTMVNDLHIIYNPQEVGIRALYDGLHALDPTGTVRFVIVNSVDQTLALQLKILSRVNEINFWRNNFLHAVLVGLPVMALSWTHSLLPWNRWRLFPGVYVTLVIQLVLTVYIQFWLARPFLKKFVVFVVKRANALMDVLVSISTMVLFVFSLFAMAVGAYNGKTQDRVPKTLFETTAMLVMFISFGKWLENRAKGATLTALSKLLQLTPTSCTIVADVKAYEADPLAPYTTRTIGVDLIQAGDVAVVLPGAKISADGRIIDGETEVDELLITGELLPVYKGPGDEVIGGLINGLGALHIKVTRSLKKSQLQQIINLVKELQVNRAPVQRFADFVAARFVPLVIVLALTTFVIWLMICMAIHPDRLPMVFSKDENGRFFVCLKLGISVIIVACPCALGLAAPTAVMVGTGVGAEHGVLIKGGDIFERVQGLNVLLFDKTGTLTTGRMRVVNFHQVGKHMSDDWWGMVGALEETSEHPVGRLIVQGARRELGLTFEGDVLPWLASDTKTFAGLGLRGICTKGAMAHTVYVGNYNMIKREFPHLELAELDSVVLHLEALVNTMAHVVIDGEYAGYIELTDQLKANTKEIIHHLNYVEGYQVGIVTGDSRGAALKIAKELGIPSSNVFAEVSPVHKDKVIVDLKTRLPGVGVGFIGDGINDAPALAQADVGMAISSGTDIAMELADVVLLGGSSQQRGDLYGVVTALAISRATFSRVKWNFVWAALYNLVMLPFAMGCFLPLNLMLPPIAAGAAMMLSLVSVVVNSLMLKRWQPPVLNGLPVDYEDDEFGGFDLSKGTMEQFEYVKRDRRMEHRVRQMVMRSMRDFRVTTSEGYQQL